MQLCRGTDNQEFAAVWFSYKWKLCVSLALQVPNSREVTCLKAVATYEEGLWISDPNVLLYLHLSQVPTLPSLLCTWKNDFFFYSLHFVFLVYLKNYFIPIRHLTYFFFGAFSPYIFKTFLWKKTLPDREIKVVSYCWRRWRNLFHPGRCSREYEALFLLNQVESHSW